MKKIKLSMTLLLPLFLATASLNAQTWGIEGGYTMTGLQQAEGSTSGDFNLLNGAHLGVRVDFLLNNPEAKNRLTLGGGIQFEMRAGRYDAGWIPNLPGWTHTRILYYGVMPIDLTLHHPLTATKHPVNLLVFAGPRLNVGIFGSTNEHYYLGYAEQVNDKVPFEGALNRFDLGVGAGIGVQYRWLACRLGYEFPLTNTANEPNPSTLKQHQFKFTVGYSFKGKKKKK